MKRLLLFITICISPVSFGQIPSYVPSDSLVAWYPFNGNTNDESGNGVTMTNLGAMLSEDRMGNAQSAYDFDGIDDHMIIDNLFDYSESSFNCFIHPKGFLGNVCLDCATAQIIYSTDNNLLQHGMKGAYLSAVETPESIIMLQGGQAYQEDVNFNEWTMITLVFREDSTLYYVNGELLGTTVKGFIYSTALYLPEWTNIGGRYTGSSDINQVGNMGTNRHFNGLIDDIGIWNRALTECEIMELYTGQDCTVGISELNSIQPKELIKIVNLLGQEVEYAPNTVLIYQYSDGTSEKVCTIED